MIDVMLVRSATSDIKSSEAQSQVLTVSKIAAGREAADVGTSHKFTKEFAGMLLISGTTTMPHVR